MKSISFLTVARRAWRGLPNEVREKLDGALQRYASEGQGDVKKLRGRPGSRLRWGDYRIVFIEDENGIEVRAVGHRKDVYT